MPEAAVVVWADHAVDFVSFDAVIVRSAWDDHTRRDASRSGVP